MPFGALVDSNNRPNFASNLLSVHVPMRHRVLGGLRLGAQNPNQAKGDGSVQRALPKTGCLLSPRSGRNQSRKSCQRSAPCGHSVSPSLSH